jgi:hypothetical protein
VKGALGAIALVGALAGLAGCSSFDHLEFVLDSTPPLEVVVTYDEIRIPEGVAVIATARPTAEDGVMSSDTKVQLRTADPAVLGVALALPQALDEGGDDAPWTHVLLGVRAGSTAVIVTVDGDEKKQIPAHVEPQ